MTALADERVSTSKYMDGLKAQRLGGVVTHMNAVEYLVGSEKICNLPLPTYSDEICSFISDLSAALMRLPEARQYPDITALAFWCRKANIQKLKSRYSDASSRLGRGLCFHIAPSNIPINFAFSYLFSLLAGNANIARISSKPFPQVEPVCFAINETLSKYPEILRRTAFVRYAADDTITAEMCKQADARMIWGGDATIEKIKNMPAKPRCIDIAFADRYSVCIINGQAILNADDTSIKRLAEGFYNDTYLVDQNACSSPQLIFWMDDNEESRKRFWMAVYDYAERRYNLQPALAVDKYTQLCKDAIDLDIIKSAGYKGNLLYNIELSSLHENMECFRGKCGYFYEYNLKSLRDLENIVTEKYQTITYYGIDPNQIQDFVINSRLRGIDRIVPVGKALDISAVWDGFDLVIMLSRIVHVE